MCWLIFVETVNSWWIKFLIFFCNNVKVTFLSTYWIDPCKINFFYFKKKKNKWNKAAGESGRWVLFSCFSLLVIAAWLFQHKRAGRGVKRPLGHCFPQHREVMILGWVTSGKEARAKNVCKWHVSRTCMLTPHTPPYSFTLSHTASDRERETIWW